MNWRAFILYSFVWVCLGPILAVAFGADPMSGLIGSSITYVFPIGGIWLCAVMAGVFD